MIGGTDNARGGRRSEERFSCDVPLGSGEEPPLGSHLVTPRTFYTHHGIYIGNGRVIHYSGLAYGLRRGPVEDTSLERFAHGHSIRVRRDARCFSPCEVVERVRSRLGERNYRILTNNCQHLCAWALRDERRSGQIDYFRGATAAMWRAIRAARVFRRDSLIDWSIARTAGTWLAIRESSHAK